MRIVISLDKDGEENDYVRSLRAAGVAPEELLFLPLNPDDARLAVAGADGLLLGGGEDVEPSRYGDVPRATNLEVSPERDAREIAAHDEARRNALPLFAICRGLQLVNVARGGTLVQDIPTELPDGGVAHRVQPKDAPAHAVLVEPGGAGALLRDAFGGEVTPVNSRHHQCVARLAPGLVVAALAPDGVVEAVAEATPSHDFFLAVQWHPENLAESNEGQAALFTRFVRACRERADRGAPVAEMETVS